MMQTISQNRRRGFTLVELMITVAVVAILAAIALPSYTQYIRRSDRTVVKSTMIDLIARQEGYNLDHKRYATTFAKLGFSSGAQYVDRQGNLSATSTSSSIYQASLQGNPGSSSCPPGGSASAAGFTIAMVPIGAQAADTGCGTLCLSSAGIRSASGTSTDCWSR